MERLYDIAMREVEIYFNKKGRDKSATDLINDKHSILGIIHTAKLGNYPFNWLSRQQRNFLDQGGEDWLASFLERNKPLFDRSDEYREISLMEMTGVLKEIMEDLNLNFLRMYPVYFDRFFRLKISVKNYKKFDYIAIPISFLYGIKHKKFSFNEKERGYGEFLALYFLFNFLDSFIHIKNDEAVFEITEEKLDTVKRIISVLNVPKIEEKVENLIDRYNKVKDSFIDEESLVKLSEEFKNPDLVIFEEELVKALPGNAKKELGKLIGINFRVLSKYINKKTLTPKKKEELLSKAMQLRIDERTRKLGDILYDIFSRKETGKRGVLSRTMSLDSVTLRKEDLEKLGDSFVSTFFEEGQFPKGIELDDRSKVVLGKIVKKLVDFVKEENGKVPDIEKMVLYLS